MDLSAFIDHTILKPEASSSQIDQLCQEAITHSFKAVCVNSSFVKRCVKNLKGSKVVTCSVIGFPLGAMESEAKVFEAQRCLKAGAAEIDMVINVGALKERNQQLVLDDIRSVANICHSNNSILKVIIETCLLSHEEKVLACRLSEQAGADFVKTSTGFSTGGATVEDIKLMRSVVSPRIKVKASGGIRDKATAIAMIGAGADRIGASSSVKIVS